MSSERAGPAHPLLAISCPSPRVGSEIATCAFTANASRRRPSPNAPHLTVLADTVADIFPGRRAHRDLGSYRRYHSRCRLARGAVTVPSSPASRLPAASGTEGVAATRATSLLESRRSDCKLGGRSRDESDPGRMRFPRVAGQAASGLRCSSRNQSRLAPDPTPVPRATVGAAGSRSLLQPRRRRGPFGR